MGEQDPLTRLLGTPGKDAGCEGALTLLAAYVEGELEGQNVRRMLPAVAEHVHNCPACAEDYEGLVALAREPRCGS